MSHGPPAVPLAANRSARLALLLLLAFVAATLAIAATRQEASMRPALRLHAPVDPARLSQADLEQTAGVRVLRVTTTAGGGLVDVRYQVIDEQKAGSIHTAAAPPALVDEHTGRIVDRDWMGHASHPTPHLGRTYYLLLVNPGVLRPGSGVTVRMGAATLEHVLVR